MAHLVRFTDIEDHIARKQWAEDNCGSFINLTITDFSDFSYGMSSYDTGFEFVFADEADAIIFKLRWS